MTELMPATAASIILWDAEHEEFVESTSTIPRQSPSYVLDRVRSEGGVSRWIVEHQRPHVVPDVADDRFRASVMMHESGLAAYVGVPLLFEGESLGVLYALDDHVRDYQPTDIDFMTILARRAASAIGLAQLLARLQELASTDELTGLANRRDFLARGQAEFDRESRLERPLSAILIDVDRFKAINDRHGHAAGDVVLAEIARRIRGQLRAFDIVARIGGEEFAVLLPEVDRNLGERIAERIRYAVSASPIQTDRSAVETTITLGVAEATDRTKDLLTLLDHADAALFDGKAAGRNCVSVLDDTGPVRHGSSSLVGD